MGHNPLSDTQISHNCGFEWHGNASNGYITKEQLRILHFFPSLAHHIVQLEHGNAWMGLNL